uniref:Ferredoxin thioredoxin reductase alpha chain domain-containing protein n=1 Tax=Kalanchoe fedtschenkoi TaxID=63787 RepID=A0A7N0UH77_KALFE
MATLYLTAASLNAFPLPSSSYPSDMPSSAPAISPPLTLYTHHHSAATTSFHRCSPSTAASITAPRSAVSRRLVTCQVALRSESESSAAETGEEAISKVGSRVRVKVPLKVYHVPKVAEVDLTGKEGVIKQYVGVWKGKRISANLPYKVEFQAEVPERGVVKFSAHLREDEFEVIA